METLQIAQAREQPQTTVARPAGREARGRRRRRGRRQPLSRLVDADVACATRRFVHLLQLRGLSRVTTSAMNPTPTRSTGDEVLAVLERSPPSRPPHPMSICARAHSSWFLRASGESRFVLNSARPANCPCPPRSPSPPGSPTSMLHAHARRHPPLGRRRQRCSRTTCSGAWPWVNLIECRAFRVMHLDSEARERGRRRPRPLERQRSP